MSDKTNDNMPISPDDQNIEPINIEDEMKRSYLDYAMSVIISRALPDVRDGLKPVHRRILYSMFEAGYTHDKPYRKSARVVGNVIGKYHPHGDAAVYDALVRMAQDFSMGLPLLDGQGNFGSIDNDPPAAMRYTEVKLDRTAAHLLTDIDKNTVDFQPNYDESESEPQVLPAQYPNLLVNGAGGIAVGMATNIPPHNLGEVIDATIAIVDNPAIEDSELLDIIPGPDFPTGAQIVGHGGSQSGLTRGRGSVIMRAKTHIEESRQGRQTIVVSEIPYQVNKAALVEKIADLVREKRVEGIADLRDESNRLGIRVVIEIKRDASADVVLNQLYRFSQLQTSFGVNMLALNGGRPELMNLRQILKAFIAFREEVLARRTKFELSKARDRAHVLVGLALAVAHIDEVIRIIRTAPDPSSARMALLDRPWPVSNMAPLIALIADPRSREDEKGNIWLSDEQARAILDLRLHRLTGLGTEDIGNEAKKLSGNIQDYLDILSNRKRILDMVKADLRAVKEQFAVPRRSEIIMSDLDLEDEDLIEREDMVVTVTHGGYVKRTPLSIYRTQHRGGKGRSGMAMKDKDFVTRLFAASTHSEILFFSSSGMVYKQKVWRLPPGAPQSRGKALVNILPLEKDEYITSVMPLPESDEERAELDVMFATLRGGVRRNKLSDFVQVNRNGKIAMKPDEGDGIIGVQICSARDDVLLTTKGGFCIRFPVEDIRIFSGRTSTGVRGIRLGADDDVISLSILRHIEATPAEWKAYLRHANAMRKALDTDGTGVPVEAVDNDLVEGSSDAIMLSPERIAYLGAAEQFILTLTQDGIGKRASAYDYRVTGRGGKGLIAHKLTDTQSLAASFPVEESDQIMLVTDKGQLIRCKVEQVRIAGRATQGVRIIRIAAGEQVVSVERLAEQDDDNPDDNAG